MHRVSNITNYAAEEWSSATQPNLHALVLQPIGHLDRTNCQEFQMLLEKALGQSAQGVIVDFLWVELVDESGIQTLVSGIEQAAKLGKTISFSAMNYAIQVAMEAEWDRQRDIRFGSWQDLFESDLEQFLEDQWSV